MIRRHPSCDIYFTIHWVTKSLSKSFIHFDWYALLWAYPDRMDLRGFYFVLDFYYGQEQNGSVE